MSRGSYFNEVAQYQSCYNAALRLYIGYVAKSNLILISNKSVSVQAHNLQTCNIPADPTSTSATFHIILDLILIVRGQTQPSESTRFSDPLAIPDENNGGRTEKRGNGRQN